MPSNDQARHFSTALRAVSEDEAEEITRKYGLEAGLFSIFKSTDKNGKAIKAKDLLAKYGSAYLVTSISLSIVSFSLCYALISAGVDVADLLAKVNRHADLISREFMTNIRSSAKIWWRGLVQEVAAAHMTA